MKKVTIYNSIDEVVANYIVNNNYKDICEDILLDESKLYLLDIEDEEMIREELVNVNDLNSMIELLNISGYGVIVNE